MTDIKDLIAKMDELPNAPLFLAGLPLSTVPFYTDDLKALAQRLDEAEKVIEHYADSEHWVDANWDGEPDRPIMYWDGESRCGHDCDYNGYDKARAYLSEKK